MKKTDFILHVENEPDDIFIIQRALKKVGIENPIKTVENGESAVEYLLGTAPSETGEANPMPSLMLLDLSMPRMGGIEVLKWMRSQPNISRIIVVVLTSSQNEQDIAAAYANGANAYLVKPVGALEFNSVLTSLKTFWLENNTFPDVYAEL